MRLTHEVASLRRQVVAALGSIGDQRAVEALIARLDDPDAYVRREALSGLVQGLDPTDRKLVSPALDGIWPWLDPREPITLVFAQHAAARLKLSLEDVQARYEALAERFGLRLKWRERAAPSKSSEAAPQSEP